MFPWSESEATQSRWQSETRRAFSGNDAVFSTCAPPLPPTSGTAGLPPHRGDPLKLFGATNIAAGAVSVTAAASVDTVAEVATVEEVAADDGDDTWVMVEPPVLVEEEEEEGDDHRTAFDAVADELAALDSARTGLVTLGALRRVCSNHGVWPPREAVKPLVVAWRGEGRRIMWGRFLSALAAAQDAFAEAAADSSSSTTTAAKKIAAILVEDESEAEGGGGGDGVEVKASRFLANGVVSRESGRAPFCLYNSAQSHNRNVAMERKRGAAKAVRKASTIAVRSKKTKKKNQAAKTRAAAAAAAAVAAPPTPPAAAVEVDEEQRDASADDDTTPLKAAAATAAAAPAVVAAKSDAAALAASLEARYRSVREAFLGADQDRSGYLEKSEVLRLCAIFNHRGAAIERLVALVDANEDHCIDYNEFASRLIEGRHVDDESSAAAVMAASASDCVAAAVTAGRRIERGDSAKSVIWGGR